jgi:hypothetical protein
MTLGQFHLHPIPKKDFTAIYVCVLSYHLLFGSEEAAFQEISKPKICRALFIIFLNRTTFPQHFISRFNLQENS